MYNVSVDWRHDNKTHKIGHMTREPFDLATIWVKQIAYDNDQ